MGDFVTSRWLQHRTGNSGGLAGKAPVLKRIGGVENNDLTARRRNPGGDRRLYSCAARRCYCALTAGGGARGALVAENLA